VLNNTNKTQLNRIAEYIDTLFGVVNENGVIEYCSAGDTLPGKIQQISEKVSDVILSAKSDTYNPSFFAKEDILFHNITVDEDEERFLFIQLSETTNEEYGKRLLGLAAFAIECSNQQNNKNVMSLFRKLIIDGKQTVDEKMIMDVYAEYTTGVTSYMVLLVTKYKGDSRYEADDGEVCNVLRSVFPDKQGFIVLPVDNMSSAIICPINDTNTYEDMLQYASTIHDTIISEAMTDVYVSAGSIVSHIMDISKSYHEAESAIKIGLTFGINQKCFVYSKLSLEKLICSIPKESARMYIHELFGEGFFMDKSAKELLNTVHVFLMNNLNVSEASRALYIHRNTLMYRLDKFNKMTNLDCTKFATGMQVDIALRVLQYLEN